MPDLIDLLESFNRKERFFLISQALGSFQLCDEFRTKLSRETDLAIPHGAFMAIDYHLDWLTSALYAHACGDHRKIFDNPQQLVIKGNQQDIDLLVAFREKEKCHIVLVEAKGATGWNNGQMRSKADRLSQIFGSEGNCYPRVVPHFCLVSPRPPEQLTANEWPAWMSKEDGSYFWIKLTMAPGRKKVTRCDSGGKQSKIGTHFRIIPA